MGWLRRTSAWLPGRRHATPPPPESRTWTHPSELPSFDSVIVARREVRSRLARLIASAMVVALLAGGAALASTRSAPPANGAMTAHLAASADELPAVARVAAEGMVDLTITKPGHVQNVAAMVLPHDLAVTTTVITKGSLITGSIDSAVNFPVTWIGRDASLGLTIVRLNHRVTPLAFAPLPNNAAVTAVSPVMLSSVSPPKFAWAPTTLGDPIVHANGVVSYLATDSNGQLNGFVDAVAVNAQGRVVGVLSVNHVWLSAAFVAKVAAIVVSGDGCHASLGITGSNAQGGGVSVEMVTPQSSASGHLRSGDVLTNVNGTDIDSWNTLLRVLYLIPAGTSVPLTFVRDAQIHHAEVILACAL